MIKGKGFPLGKYPIFNRPDWSNPLLEYARSKEAPPGWRPRVFLETEDHQQGLGISMYLYDYRRAKDLTFSDHKLIEEKYEALCTIAEGSGLVILSSWLYTTGLRHFVEFNKQTHRILSTKLAVLKDQLTEQDIDRLFEAIPHIERVWRSQEEKYSNG